MNQQVEALTRLLHCHLRSQDGPSSRLPKKKSPDAFAIVTVVNSLRGACLLSSLTATRTTLIALQDSIAASSGGDTVAIVTHQASQQVFIVNKDNLLQRARSPLRLLFYAIDAEVQDETDRIQHDQSWYLASSLESLCSALSEADKAEEKHGIPPIIIVGSGDESPLHGISLAGWLLGYDVVYFYRHLPSTFAPSSRIWHREQPFQSDCWADDAGGSRSNCLSRNPLVVIRVRLASGEDLYQYTFPCSVIRHVCMLFELKEGAGLPEICEALELRLQRQTTPASILQVSYDTVTQEHITM